MLRLQTTLALFWCVTAGVHAQQLDRPLRAVHLSGNWGHTADAVALWETDRTQPLVPLRYIEYLRSVHVDWVGFSVALHVEHSMDSTLERAYSGVRVPTFSDDAIRQVIREFRVHGFNVYMTLAIESFETEDELDAVEHPAPRFQLGDPGYPDTGVPDDHLYCTCARRIHPDFWPWRPSHPDHERFVAEFWESYAQQAIHFARIAQEEGAAMYSLGTETERLFRTRSGGDYWVNDFGPQLLSMVDRVRAVYSGLLTYDMSYKAYWRDWFAPGSWHLWEDLDLDVIGVSAWFPLVDDPPTRVMSVGSLRRAYERIFRDHLIPMAERNPGRPMVFLEYGAPDSVQAPADPARFPENPHVVFVDANENGLEDGAEVQDNMYRALFEVMNAHPGLMYGAFFWDTWITVYEGQWEALSRYRAYSFKGKLSEHAVREWYDRLRTTAWRLPVDLHVNSSGAVAAALRFARPVQASSSAPHVTVTVDGSRVILTPLSEGSTTITVTAAGITHHFSVRVLPMERPAGDVQAGTAVRAIHFLALRTQVDALRAAENLPAVRWTDPVLTVGATPVKRVHLVELRDALADVYDTVGRRRPAYMDGTIIAGVTEIKADHFEQLRAAILALTN